MVTENDGASRVSGPDPVMFAKRAFAPHRDPLAIAEGDIGGNLRARPRRQSPPPADMTVAGEMEHPQGVGIAPRFEKGGGGIQDLGNRETHHQHATTARRGTPADRIFPASAVNPVIVVDAPAEDLLGIVRACKPGKFRVRFPQQMAAPGWTRSAPCMRCTRACRKCRKCRKCRVIPAAIC